jgi:hypothetical protein
MNGAQRASIVRIAIAAVQGRLATVSPATPSCAPDVATIIGVTRN